MENRKFEKEALSKIMACSVQSSLALISFSFSPFFFITNFHSRAYTKMGLKNMFRPPREMDAEESKEFLEKNGVVVKDKNSMYKKKFKFGEFGKYTEQMAKQKDNTLRPIIQNYNTGYGDYDENINQGDSNQGYGYDEHANDFKGNGNKADNEYSSPYSGSYSNSYSGDCSNSYGYTGDNSNNNSYRSRPSPGRPENNRNEYSSTVNDQRRPKVNTYSSNSNQNYDDYNPSRPVNTKSTSAAKSTYAATISPSNGYGYEPSIKSFSENNDYAGYEPSVNNYNGYGFDPYSESAVTAKSTARLKKTKTSNSTVTQCTYDPYAPGEEPYGSTAGNTNDPYGSYEPDDVYDGYADDYANAITENTNTNEVSGLSTGMQGLQLQEQEQHQKQSNIQDQESTFDPYGPSAGLQQQDLVSTHDLDLNAYEPAVQDNIYDNDEFGEEVDEDEEELNRIQRQTKDVREDTVNLSRTLVDNLGQANVTASNTLGVLGSQREKIYEMENNIGTMKVQQRFVDDHVKDLEHYNRSLFHIKVNNPFTRNSRRRAKDQAFLAQRQEDRANKDKLNNDLYQSQRAIMDQLNSDHVKSELQEKYDYDRRVKEASKYLTKDHDEEDERMEVEIAANVDQAQKLALNLKKKAQLMNTEIQQQNRDLKNVSENVDHMDDKIVMTTRRIRGI